MNEQQVTKKRDWIKNAMIVFLSIMLVLTFFSNTIMNYSLPEVSAQYTMGGSIEAKVRGNGVVSAGDPYTVKADSSKVIESVAFRNGDHVEKGDVIFFLEEGESTELKTAEKELKALEKELENLQDSYRQEALAMNVDPETTNKILSGNYTSYNTFRNQINALKNEIKALEDEATVFETEVAKVEDLLKEAERVTGGTDAGVKYDAYIAAVGVRQNAETALKNAITEAAKADASVKDVATAKAALTAVNTELEAKQNAVNAITSGTAYEQAETVRVGYEAALATAKENLESVIASGTGGEFANGTSGPTKQEAAQDAWTQAETNLKNHMNSQIYADLSAAQTALDTAQAKAAPFEKVVSAEVALTDAQSAENAAWKAYEQGGQNNTAQINQYTEVIKINRDYANGLRAEAQAKQDEIQELLNKMSQESALSLKLDGIQAKQEEIDEKKEQITKLTETAVGGNITAPISGTIQNLTLIAGESTTAGNEVAMILPDGKGYTMEVGVTKEQAQRLNVGDVAEVQNAWYYSDVKIVLRQIRADKSDPANKKILVFQVEGDVADGQSLSISIGQQSAYYDVIVPNSAVREDSNGKFILIVTQKASPLGNRYYAKRVDVEVLASDDKQSAVTGDMSSWEFVITTSTKPIEAGQLIRLAE